MNKELGELKITAALLEDIRENGFKTVEVPLEKSVMGIIHRDLENQTEETRENRRQEERHYTENNRKSDRDQTKQFKQQIFLSVFSAIVGAIITNLDRIWIGISAFIQRLF